MRCDAGENHELVYLHNIAAHPGPDDQWKLTLQMKLMSCLYCEIAVLVREQLQALHETRFTSAQSPACWTVYSIAFAGEGRKFSIDDGGLDLCQLGYHSDLLQTSTNYGDLEGQWYHLLIDKIRL